MGNNNSSIMCVGIVEGDNKLNDKNNNNNVLGGL